VVSTVVPPDAAQDMTTWPDPFRYSTTPSGPLPVASLRMISPACALRPLAMVVTCTVAAAPVSAPPGW
jgi:hypothetical protein